MSPRVFRFELLTRGRRWRTFLGNFVRRGSPDFRLHRLLATCFGRSIKVSIMGKTIYMDLRDEAVSSALHDRGVWEPDETLFVENTLREGMVFVDIGAHIGYYTLIASAIVG